MTINYFAESKSSANVKNPSTGIESGIVTSSATAIGETANEAVEISEMISMDIAVQLGNEKVITPDAQLIITYTHTESVVTILDNEIPNISGKWNYYVKVLRQQKENQKPTFDYNYVTFPITIEQDGKFIIITSQADPPTRPLAGYQVGCWNKVHYGTSFFWQLGISDYDDNGVYKLTASKIENGIIKEITGNYTESGFSLTNPDQLPTNGEVIFTRI